MLCRKAEWCRRLAARCSLQSRVHHRVALRSAELFAICKKALLFSRGSTKDLTLHLRMELEFKLGNQSIC